MRSPVSWLWDTLRGVGGRDGSPSTKCCTLGAHICPSIIPFDKHLTMCFVLDPMQVPKDSRDN